MEAITPYPSWSVKVSKRKRGEMINDHSRWHQTSSSKWSGEWTGQQKRPRSLPTTSQLISCSQEKSDLKMKIIQEDAGPLLNKRSTTKERKRRKITPYIPHPSWSAKKWNSVQLRRTLQWSNKGTHIYLQTLWLFHFPTDQDHSGAKNIWNPVPVSVGGQTKPGRLRNHRQIANLRRRQQRWTDGCSSLEYSTAILRRRMTMITTTSTTMMLLVMSCTWRI